MIVRLGCIIYISLLFCGCYSIKDYPFRHSLLYKEEISKDTTISFDYMYRKKKGFNYITIDVTVSKRKFSYGINFTNKGIIIRIIKTKPNEKILKCENFKGAGNYNVQFERQLVTDTIDFKHPKLFEIEMDYYTYADLYKTVERKEFEFEKINEFEKKLLLQTNKLCIKHKILIENIDTTKLIGWMKYNGDCGN